MPWPAFHTDAWCATAILTGAIALLRSSNKVIWTSSEVVLALLVFVPFAQYTFGILSFFGQAWTVSAYIFGLLLAVLIGRRCEEIFPNRLGDAIFLAIGIASIVSVNLQLQTWLGLLDTGIFDIWSMGLSGARPYANLGQPNQLATLLLWGLMSCGWAYSTGRVAPWVAIFASSYLLIGVALTQSRTAWVGLTFILVISTYWRALWRSQKAPWVVAGLFIFFLLCHPLLSGLRGALGLGTDEIYFRTSAQGELRFTAWKLFISAALDRPWFGYGWSEVAKAQVAVAERFPPLYPAFGYSHNLFLDFLLWTGIPFGILLSYAVIWKFINLCKTAVTDQRALMALCLGVVGIHSMLEFPLHYGYFLFPAGIMVGILTGYDKDRLICSSPWVFRAAWLAGVCVLAMIVKDYFSVETLFQEARFRAARIGSASSLPEPKIILLTQLRDGVKFINFEVHEGMDDEDLKWLEAVATDYPSGGRAYKVAKALALNGQPEQAMKWLKLVCRISSPEECVNIQQVWSSDSLKQPAISAVDWPVKVHVK